MIENLVIYNNIDLEKIVNIAERLAIDSMKLDV